MASKHIKSKGKHIMADPNKHIITFKQKHIHGNKA